MDFCPVIKAKLFHNATFLPDVNIQVQSGPGVLGSLVPCLKSMELADQVLYGHFELVYLHQVRKMIMKMLLLEIIWLIDINSQKLTL